MRIAPPEAPVTGYMFGKGVYFADMVSKSANYCCTNKSDIEMLAVVIKVHNFKTVFTLEPTTRVSCCSATWHWVTCTRLPRYSYFVPIVLPKFTKSFPKAEYVEKLAPGFHSTKGLGKTAPDAANVKTLDGAEVG